jgi:hypothetical protein
MSQTPRLPFPRIQNPGEATAETGSGSPVKHCPPTARRSYFTEPALYLVYIFVTTPAVTLLGALAPTVAGHRRHPPRRFFSLPPTAPGVGQVSRALALGL